jgi:hypothetical protein
MPVFKRLTEADLSALSRSDLQDRIEAEQAYWHRRMDRGQMRPGDDEAYQAFTRILYEGINPGAAMDHLKDYLEGNGDDGYWDKPVRS